jgi:cytochrome c6
VVGVAERTAGAGGASIGLPTPWGKGGSMKRILLAFAAVSFAATVLAADAASIFSARCAACHGKDGKGTPVGKKMGAPELATLKASQADLAASISNGKGKMSAYKDKLSAEEIQALAKFVKGGLK